MRLPSSVSASFYSTVGRTTGTSSSPSAPAQVSESALPNSSNAPSSTVVTFSDKALAMMRQRQVSEAQQATFKDVLQRAQTDQAGADPKRFLGTLSSDELTAVQSAHCLGLPIDVNALNQEGAANLLVQPGAEQDLDNNGLTSVGAANLFTFPPNNAPESFKTAWAQATEGKSFGDIPAQMILAAGVANLKTDPATGQVTSVSPDDPSWRNPYADPSYDYGAAVSNIMEGLKQDRSHNLISETQFKHDMQFYEQLHQALG